MRYVLGFIGLVILVIFAIILVVRSVNRNVEPATTPAPALAEAASTDANFVYTDSGPIVADEDFSQIRITVDRISRRIEVIQGYQNTVVAQQNLDNNQEAFEQFLSALDRAGFMRERRTNFASEEGLCPTGHRYVFESDQLDASVRRWTTTCKEKGNLGGNASTIINLFRGQIPEYNQFISETRTATGLSL